MPGGFRWAVSLEETMTSPSFENTFRRAILCAAESDVDDQRKFRFKEDALACLIGRIMPRKAVTLETSLPWSHMEFVRSEKGKPSLKNAGNFCFEYNVSHHGDLVVMATGKTRVGVDVMRIDEDRRSSAGEQMNSLRRHFSQSEIDAVNGKLTEGLRWRAFFRIWCLKESILKATGVGLPDGLHNHTFHVDPREEHVPGCLLTSTKYSPRSTPQVQWKFEESFVGDKHCVAVASEEKTDTSSARFETKSLNDLLSDAEFVNVSADVDEELDVFMQKPNKPF